VRTCSRRASAVSASSNELTVSQASSRGSPMAMGSSRAGRPLKNRPIATADSLPSRRRRDLDLGQANGSFPPPGGASDSALEREHEQNHGDRGGEHHHDEVGGEH